MTRLTINDILPVVQAHLKAGADDLISMGVQVEVAMLTSCAVSCLTFMQATLDHPEWAREVVEQMMGGSPYQDEAHEDLRESGRAVVEALPVSAVREEVDA